MKFARLALAISLAACARSVSPVTLTVFGAASLSAAFAEIGEQFQAAHPGVEVIFNFAGSQQLAAQIAQGAPADVFASADEAQLLAAGERAPAGQAFAHNRLVVAVPSGSDLRAFRDLDRPGLRLLLAAPEAPAGRYALEMLDRAALDPDYGPAFREAVLANVVSYEDNVRQVAAKTALGEADAGLAYATDLGALSLASLPIPERLAGRARYVIAALADSPQPELAADFAAFTLSPAGQAILARHGFLPPEDAAP